MTDYLPMTAQQLDARPVEARASKASITPILDPCSSVFLDIVRAIAINLVVFDHANAIINGPKSFGFRGVSVVVFVFISGFLTSRILRHRRFGRYGTFGGYIVARVARLGTPLAVSLVLIAAANWIWQLPANPVYGVNRGFGAFVANLLLLNDYPVFQAVHRVWDIESIYMRSYNGAESLWTLPVEFWLYVGFGAFVYKYLDHAKFKKTQFLLIGVSAPVIVWNSFAGGGGDLTLIWVSGAFAGIAWDAYRATAREHWGPAVALAILSGASLCGRIADVGYVAYDFQCNMLLLATLFAIMLFMKGRAIPPLALKRTASFLASYSYSLFLIHNIVITVLFQMPIGRRHNTSVILSIIASHVCGMLLFYCVEKHYHKVGSQLNCAIIRTSSGVRNRRANGATVLKS